jgi:hypothetical protein
LAPEVIHYENKHSLFSFVSAVEFIFLVCIRPVFKKLNRKPEKTLPKTMTPKSKPLPKPKLAKTASIFVQVKPLAPNYKFSSGQFFEYELTPRVKFTHKDEGDPRRKVNPMTEVDH